jgi:hypothetical protein
MLRRMLGHPVVVSVVRVRVRFAGAVKDSLGHRRSRAEPNKARATLGREFAANMVNDPLTRRPYKSAWPTISMRRGGAVAWRPTERMVRRKPAAHVMRGGVRLTEEDTRLH